MYKDDDLATKILMSECNSHSIAELVNVIENLLVNVKVANKELAKEDKNTCMFLKCKTGYVYRKQGYEMTEKSLKCLYNELLSIYDNFLNDDFTD